MTNTTQETNHMTTMKQLLDDAFTCNVRVAKILHVPAMCIDEDGAPQDLIDFVTDELEEVIDVIEPHCPALRSVVEDEISEDYDDEDKAISILSHMQRQMKVPFIVQVEYQILRFLTRDAEFPSGIHQGGWNYTMLEWVAAQSIEDALQQGIELSKESMRKSWEEAPLSKRAASG